MNIRQGPAQKAVVGLRPSFSAHVRWCEHGAPLCICCPATGLRGRPAVSHISRKTSEMPRISCTQLWKEPRAALFKESRRKFREPTKLHRKSGMWGTRLWWRGWSQPVAVEPTAVPPVRSGSQGKMRESSDFPGWWRAHPKWLAGDDGIAVTLIGQGRRQDAIF
jgi:hypothetical protein